MMAEPEKVNEKIFAHIQKLLHFVISVKKKL